MTINFTIIIQIINFLVAYFIISRIFLKPSVSIIQKDSKIENELLNLIRSREQKINNKEIYKQALWNKSLNQFEKEKPVLEKEKIGIKLQTPTQIQISEDSKNELKKNIISSIIKRVQNVEQ